MNDIKENEFPPHGWAFRQPQTAWSNPMAMVGFKASVEAIIKHRLANKAITAKHNLSTDEYMVAEELKAYTRLRLGLPPPPPPAPPSSPASFFQPGHSNPPHREGVVVAAGDRILRAAKGTAVPLDWIQSGGDPVPQELAEKRASICVQCPKNVQGAWYVEAPAELFAAALRGWQKLKGSDFEFKTKQGDKLKSCDVCACILRFKTFCPLEHIIAKTPPEIMVEFPPNCWIARRDQ